MSKKEGCGCWRTYFGDPLRVAKVRTLKIIFCDKTIYNMQLRVGGGDKLLACDVYVAGKSPVNLQKKNHNES